MVFHCTISRLSSSGIEVSVILLRGKRYSSWSNLPTCIILLRLTVNSWHKRNTSRCDLIFHSIHWRTAHVNLFLSWHKCCIFSSVWGCTFNLLYSDLISWIGDCRNWCLSYPFGCCFIKRLGWSDFHWDRKRFNPTGWVFLVSGLRRFIHLAPVVQTLDSAIHRINLYPADKY